MKKVTIIDDTLRLNRTTRVPLEEHQRQEAAKRGLPYSKDVIKNGVPAQLYTKIKGGGTVKIMDQMTQRLTFEGEHLENAIRRARRWLLNKSQTRRNAPRHVALKIAAFAKADPDGFKATLARAVNA